MLSSTTPVDPVEASLCLRDVVALSTLPMVWLGAAPVRVAESLAAALFAALEPEFVCVCLNAEQGECVEVAQTSRHGSDAALAASLAPRLQAWVREHDPDDLLIVEGREGAPVRITVRPIGHNAERGLVAAAFSEEGTPTAMHHLLLNVGATQAASAIENATLLLSLRRSLQEREKAAAREREARETAETLNIVSRRLAAELELEPLVQAVTDAGTRLTGAEFGAFFYNVVDAKGESYMLYTISGVPRERFSSFPLPRNTPLFARTFRGEGTVRCDDVREHPDFGKNPPRKGMPAGHLPVTSYLAVPVISRSGEVIGGLFFGHARRGVFTERAERLAVGIAAQAAIAIDNARLFERAEREIAERKQAQQALQRANEELERFAAIASHDLKEPLRGIAHLVGFIMEDEPDVLSASSMERLRRVERQCVRLSAMVSGLLEYAKTGGDRPHRLCDLREAVHQAMEKLSDSVRDRACQVVISEGLPKVYGDPLLLERVFANLISNSVRYNDAALRRVEIGVQDGEIFVRDNGVGIDPRQHSKLFQVFSRVRNDDRAGTGLGLAIVKRIMEIHGGSIRVASMPDEGTTFYLRFPPPPQGAESPG